MPNNARLQQSNNNNNSSSNSNSKLKWRRKDKRPREEVINVPLHNEARLLLQDKKDQVEEVSLKKGSQGNSSHLELVHKA